MPNTMARQQANGQDPRQRIIREFGPIEKWMEGVYYNNCYAATLVNCRYAVPESWRDARKHRKLLGMLEYAVALITLEYPLMQVGMLDEDTKKPLFISLDSIDLRHHIDWHVCDEHESYATDFQETVQRALDEQFPDTATRPAWKVFIFRRINSPSVDIIFRWRHSIGDGTSGKLFHQSMSRLLNTPGAMDQYINLRHHVLTLEQHPPEYYPPRMEDLAEFPVSKRWAAGYAWENLVKKSKTSEITWAPMKPGPTVTVRRAVSVPGQRMAALIQACRAHKTTITGLLHGMMFVWFARELPEGQSPTTFSACTAVNNRPFLPDAPPKFPERKQDPNTIFANIVTTTEHEFSKELLDDTRKKIKKEGHEAAIWSVATHVRELLSKRLAEGLKDQPTTLIKMISDSRAEVLKWSQKPRTLLWDVTNIGAIDPAPANIRNPEWAINRASFIACAQTDGQLFTLCPMSVKGGEMLMDIVWQDDTMHDQLGEDLTEDLRFWLNEMSLTA